MVAACNVDISEDVKQELSDLPDEVRLRLMSGQASDDLMGYEVTDVERQQNTLWVYRAGNPLYLLSDGECSYAMKFYTDMHNPKLKHRLHRIKVPTLVVWGEQDGLTTKDYGKAYADHISGAQFKTISEAGHYPHMEQPEAFLKEVRAFL